RPRVHAERLQRCPHLRPAGAGAALRRRARRSRGVRGDRGARGHVDGPRRERSLVIDITEPPKVSVVLVNFRGADDTLTCLAALRELDWPAGSLEVIVVENGSGDDSAARLRAGAPEAKLVVSKENLGFAGGCNLGAAKASGRYVAFLNNDARPDPLWL